MSIYASQVQIQVYYSYVYVYQLGLDLGILAMYWYTIVMSMYTSQVQVYYSYVYLCKLGLGLGILQLCLFMLARSRSRYTSYVLVYYSYVYICQLGSQYTQIWTQLYSISIKYERLVLKSQYHMERDVTKPLFINIITNHIQIKSYKYTIHTKM